MWKGYYEYLGKRQPATLTVDWFNATSSKVNATFTTAPQVQLDLTGGFRCLSAKSLHARSGNVAWHGHLCSGWLVLSALSGSFQRRDRISSISSVPALNRDWRLYSDTSICCHSSLHPRRRLWSGDSTVQPWGALLSWGVREAGLGPIGPQGCADLLAVISVWGGKQGFCCDVYGYCCLICVHFPRRHITFPLLIAVGQGPKGHRAPEIRSFGVNGQLSSEPLKSCWSVGSRFSTLCPPLSADGLPC